MGLFDLFPWRRRKKEAKKKAEQAIKSPDSAKPSEEEEQVERIMQQIFDDHTNATLPDDILAPLLSNFSFDSNCHQRYENGEPVQDMIVCPRHIMIRKNVSGCQGYNLEPGDGYIVSVVNGETGGKQFADKPMRLVGATRGEILLMGYPVEAMSPYGRKDLDLSDYGLSIFHIKGKIVRCVLHLYDRNTRIEYTREKPEWYEYLSLLQGKFAIISLYRDELVVDYKEGKLPVLAVCINPVFVDNKGEKHVDKSFNERTIRLFFSDDQGCVNHFLKIAESGELWTVPDIGAYYHINFRTGHGTVDAFLLTYLLMYLR